MTSECDDHPFVTVDELIDRFEVGDPAFHPPEAWSVLALVLAEDEIVSTDDGAARGLSAGDEVATLFGSAQRDPRRFESIWSGIRPDSGGITDRNAGVCVVSSRRGATRSTR